MLGYTPGVNGTPWTPGETSDLVSALTPGQDIFLGVYLALSCNSIHVYLSVLYFKAAAAFIRECMDEKVTSGPWGTS